MFHNVNFAITNSWQGSVGHFWSLAVEEQFYLIWPLLVLFLSQKALIRFIFFVIPLVLIYRVTAKLIGVEDIAIGVMLPNSMDALCLGALLAVGLNRSRLMSSQRLPIMLAGLGLLLGVFGRVTELPQIVQTSGFQSTALAVFFTWLVLKASEGNKGLMGRVLENPILTYLGKISYGIYVLHNFVSYTLSTYIFSNPFLNFLNLPTKAIISGLATIALAALSWQFFEKPINKFRRSIAYVPHNGTTKGD
jgi:peptidoglycan/LPS O-acetylase OafA/YrhL